MFKPRSNLSLRPFGATLLVLALGAGLSSAAGAVERWVPRGPVGGAIGPLAQAPTDPQRLYAATERFGVYRSRDGGLSWQPAQSGLVGSSVQRLVVAPDDPEVVLAVTQGPGSAHRIWRSSDGGAHWLPAVKPPRRERALLLPYDLVFASDAPQTVYAATENGLFRSPDGGSSWDFWTLSGVLAVALARDPQAPATWFVAGISRADLHSSIYRSDDAGATWRETPSVGRPSFDDLPGLLFFRAGALYAQWSGALYRSTDGAATWSTAAQLQGLYGVEFAFAPSGSIYAATDYGVYSSTDGTHWSPPEVFSTDQASPKDAIRHLAFLPGDPGAGTETVIAAGRRGFWRSTDQGESWHAANRGIAAHDVGSLIVIPNPQGTVIGRFEDALYRIDRAGTTWQRLATPVVEYDSPALAVDPHHPGRIYALGESLYVSEDRGNSWRTAGELPHNNVTMLKVDPVHPGVLYAGVTHGQASSENPFGYRSVDGGVTWTQILGFEELLDVVFDSARPNLGFFLTQISVYKTTDGGATWASLPGLGDQLGSFPSSILIDSRSHALYVGTEQSGVFRSANGGRTFRRIVGGLPRLPGGRQPDVATLLQDAAGDLYAGLVSAGVFRLAPGQGWQAVNAGLPLETFAGLLVADPGRPGLLYAGSMGSSVLRLENR
ncbi:MAG TPA: hypothetical protein VN851_26060 [Thermoanaerobaculia bacterium]|nr:hypothetical protein [Thermoanaerobaculia bacterium]